MDWEVDAAEKGGYEHFMFKEIMEQPEALRRAIFPRIRDGEVVLEDFGLDRGVPAKCRQDLHRGLRLLLPRGHGRQSTTWSGLLRIPVEVALASEFRYMDPIVDEQDPGHRHQPVR